MEEQVGSNSVSDPGWSQEGGLVGDWWDYM